MRFGFVRINHQVRSKLVLPKFADRSVRLAIAAF
jgi:hypothetical protein